MSQSWWKGDEASAVTERFELLFGRVTELRDGRERHVRDVGEYPDPERVPSVRYRPSGFLSQR